MDIFDLDKDKKEFGPQKETHVDQYKRESADTSGIDEARKEAARRKMYTGILQGVSTAFGGDSHDDSFYENRREDIDAGVEEKKKARQERLDGILNKYKLDRSVLEDSREDTKFQQEQTDRGRMDDLYERKNSLDSQETKMAQDLAKRMLPSVDFSGMNAAQIEERFPELGKLLSARTANSGKNAARQQAYDQREERYIDRQTQQFSAQMDKSGIPTAMSTLAAIEAKIPPDGDIPGYGEFEGLLPDIVVGDDADFLRQEVRNLFNTELKNRSGAAVTDQELQRLRDEFGDGSWKSEDQLREGLKRYKERLSEVIRNHIAGYRPEAIDRYSERGGLSFDGYSDQVIPPTVAAPESPEQLITVSNGQETLQIEPADLADAEADGYTQVK